MNADGPDSIAAAVVGATSPNGMPGAEPGVPSAPAAIELHIERVVLPADAGLRPEQVAALLEAELIRHLALAAEGSPPETRHARSARGELRTPSAPGSDGWVAEIARVVVGEAWR